MPALAKRIEIGAEDRVELERIVRSSTAEVRMVERAQIVLEAGEGRSAAEIGRLLGCSTNTAQKWRSRYEQDGIAALTDLPRSGKPLIHSQEVRARLIAKACTRPPETLEGAQQERWTYEQLGAAVGMSALPRACDPLACRYQAAPDRLLDDDRLLPAGVRGALQRDLRFVRESAGERAGRIP